MHKGDKKVSDIRCIEPLVKIAAFLAISPCNFGPRKSNGGSSRKTCLHAVCLCFVTILLSGCQQYQKYTIIYPTMVKSLAIVDAITSLCLLLVNIVPIANLNFWNKTSYEQFMVTLVKIDVILTKYKAVVKSNQFYQQLSATLCLFAAFLIYDNYFWISSGGLTYNLVRLVEVVQKCHLYIFFILTYYFITSARQRFQCLNVLLENTVGDYIKGDEGDVKVTSLSKLFINLCDNVELFNAIFGWSILVSLTYIMSSILLWINYLITYWGSDYFNLGWFGINLVMTKVLWTGYTVVMTFILAKSADDVTKQVRRTNMICFKLAQALQDTNPQDEELRNELISLAQQASSRCPRFTAAGFFDIDYTMLFTLINMFTSYVIVLIQFHK